MFSVSCLGNPLVTAIICLHSLFPSSPTASLDWRGIHFTLEEIRTITFIPFAQSSCLLTSLTCYCCVLEQVLELCGKVKRSGLQFPTPLANWIELPDMLVGGSVQNMWKGNRKQLFIFLFCVHPLHPSWIEVSDQIGKWVLCYPSDPNFYLRENGILSMLPVCHAVRSCKEMAEKSDWYYLLTYSYKNKPFDLICRYSQQYFH